MDVSAHVSVGKVLREHLEQGELLLDALREGEVRSLRAVGDVGVLLVRGHDDLPSVVQRDAEAGVLSPDLRETVLDQLGVRELADEWGGYHVDLELGRSSSRPRGQ